MIKAQVVFKNAVAAQVVISGYITDETNNSADVIVAIDKAVETNPAAEILLLNCYGGNVYEGIGIYNVIKEKGLNTRAEGICASMGTILFCAGKERIMGKSAVLLTHKASSTAKGNAEQLAAVAKQIAKLDSTMAGIYAETTGLTEDEVRDVLMVNGQDVYLNAQEALAYKLATKVVDGVAKTAAPQNILVNSNVKAVAAWYDKQMDNNKNEIKTMEVVKIKAALALRADASEDAVAEAFAGIVKENAEMKAKLEGLRKESEELQKKRVSSLVASAIKEGKITKAQEADFTLLASKDYDATQRTIEAMPKAKSASEFVATTPSASEDRNSWSYGDWMRKDSKGLAKMQIEKPAEFKQLKDAYRASLNEQ